MTNILGIMLEILNNYPWTRLSVRIIGVIKRQFFHMVTHLFHNSNFSHEIFAIDTWGAVICSLGHGGNHVLMILPSIWRPGFNFVGFLFRKTFLGTCFGRGLAFRAAMYSDLELNYCFPSWILLNM